MGFKYKSKIDFLPFQIIIMSANLWVLFTTKLNLFSLLPALALIGYGIWMYKTIQYLLKYPFHTEIKDVNGIPLIT